MKQFGRYKIIKKLGKGGMADVYRAYDPIVKREVALKVIKDDLSNSHNFRERFMQEANIMGSFQHRAIVPLYDFGQEQGQLYLVMALMLGGSLLHRLGPNPQPLELDEIMPLMESLASALDVAHEKGVVHRDLKPANILFDKQGHAYISDFGIAKQLDQRSKNSTREGAPIGTPGYMSPEQARGELTIDGRSDIYSLGVILFKLLTGKRPGRYSNAVLLPSVQKIIDKARAEKPEDRYATAGEMLTAFKEAVANLALGESVLIKPKKVSSPTDGDDTTFPPDPNGEPQPRDKPWWRKLMPVMGIVLLLFLVAAGALFTLNEGIGSTLATNGVSQAGVSGGQAPLPTETVGLADETTPTSVSVSSTPVPEATNTAQLPTAAPATAVPPTSVPTTVIPPTLEPTQSAEEWLQVGTDHHNNGEFELAYDAYSKALEVAPSSQLYFNRGNSSFQWGKLNSANQQHDSAIEQYDQAIADYTESIGLDANYAQAFLNRGLAYKNKGLAHRGKEEYELATSHYDLATADYSRAIEIDGQYTNAYYHRGNLHELRGNKQEAIDDYKKVLEINDSNQPKLIDGAIYGLKNLGVGD